MKMELPTSIVMFITMDPNRIQGGGVPVYVVGDASTLQTKSLSLESILDAAAHEVDEYTMMLVAH